MSMMMSMMMSVVSAVMVSMIGATFSVFSAVSVFTSIDSGLFIVTAFSAMMAVCSMLVVLFVPATFMIMQISAMMTIVVTVVVIVAMVIMMVMVAVGAVIVMKVMMMIIASMGAMTVMMMVLSILCIMIMSHMVVVVMAVSVVISIVCMGTCADPDTIHFTDGGHTLVTTTKWFVTPPWPPVPLASMCVTNNMIGGAIWHHASWNGRPLTLDLANLFIAMSMPMTIIQPPSLNGFFFTSYTCFLIGAIFGSKMPMAVVVVASLRAETTVV